MLRHKGELFASARQEIAALGEERKCGAGLGLWGRVGERRRGEGVDRQMGWPGEPSRRSCKGAEGTFSSNQPTTARFASASLHIN